MVSIPENLRAAYPAGPPFTIADLLMAVGVPPMLLHSVSTFGAEWQPAAVIGPFLNHPLPPMSPDSRPELSFQILEQPVVTQPIMTQPAAPMSYPESAEATNSDIHGLTTDDLPPFDSSQATSDGMMFERIESAWRSSIQMERQMTGLRQKLAGVLGSLGKLDRELAPDERLAADREDRDAWHDARRWLRDMAAKCHREIKSFDIGMTSAAGRRNWMEQTYKQVIEPRAPGSDLEDIRREFESYRKDMVNLQKSMQAALQGATQNGTQRAQRVLGVIRGKIRERRARMREPLGGTNMDKSVRRKR